MDRFHLGAYVRKRSGAFWEGAVVGHYSTAQTPDGIAVQLFGWIDGPVQIYPAAALELCDHSNSRLPPPPQTHVVGVTLSAEQVIAIRDALIADDVVEAYHQLYQAVDPQFCRYEPWADTEAQLRRSPPETPTPPGNQIRTAECDGKDAVPVTGQLPVGTASPQLHVLPPVVTGQMEIEPDVTAADLGANPEAAPAETCQRCQGNGEIVTDWNRYMRGHEDENGNEAVAECPDCGGEGIIDATPAPQTNVALLVESGQAFANQVRAVMHKLHGQAYSSTVSALNQFDADLHRARAALATTEGSL